MDIRLKIAAAAALLVTGTTIAWAEDVIIAPEQQTIIREYVVKHAVQPVAPPSGVDIVVGSTLPDTVEVQSLDIPDLPKTYRYVVFEGQTVVVEPSTRKIVQILR